MPIANLERTRVPGAESDAYSAFTQLFEERRNKLLRVALRITRNKEEAEDIVQEAALRALLKLNSFRGESRIDTWMAVIIVRTSISRMRSPFWRHRHVSIDSEMTGDQCSLPCIIADSGMNPERYCASYELDEILQSEIDRLKASHRSAVQLCDLEGWSYLEAADALQMKLSRFKACLSRGRRILRKRMHERLSAEDSPASKQDLRGHTAEIVEYRKPRKARTKIGRVA
jgi:RNA polymerase sigma-70 factor, ECF subfamily